MDRIDRLKEFIEKFPNDMFSRHALAMEYLKLGNEEAAEGVMRELLQHDPDHTGTYYHLGKLLEKSGRFGEAINILEDGIKTCEKTGAKHDLQELKAALMMLKDEEE
jgi:tetratricopeptide (TPR) repeat protein